jgi:hypothetical protein
MSGETHGDDVHPVAGGWITERKDQPVPLFLKLAYVGLSIFGVVYLFLFAYGEVDHATRGPLVQQANLAMDQPGRVWIGILCAVLLAFASGLLALAYKKAGQDE